MNGIIYQRQLDLPTLLEKKSFFLFGARGTGKSFLIRQQLPHARVFDLLHAPTFERLSRRPTILEETFQQPRDIIVIDEIQKLPKLLDEVHRLIEERGARFLLTGSSARKLRRGSANLLAGRAWQAHLFPLTYSEIPHFELARYLTHGGLPSIYEAEEPWEELKAYTGTYLREEIVAEAAVRKLDAFVSFLDVAALKVGEEVNFESLASDSGVPARTITNFFEVLRDTLIGFLLEPFRLTVKRKATTRAKFYLFDVGVTNALAGRREIPDASDIFGRNFEQFVILELRAFLAYQRRDERLTFWRSQSGFEVDCLVGTTLAIEIKSTTLVHERHLKGVRALREEGLIARYCIVSRDPEQRTLDGITVYPWQEFLRLLWSGQLL